VFVLILSLVATLLQGYLTWRIGSLACLSTAPRRRRLWLLSLVLWLLYLAGIYLGHYADGGLAGLLERLAMDWLGVLFIATTLMLALELLSGFGLWARPYLNRLRTAALLLALLLSGVALLQGARVPVVVRHEVVLSELPAALDGTRLVVLSDLHLGSQFRAPWLAARVAQIEPLRPDLILLLGDIFEGHGGVDEALQPILARLRPPLGLYAVTGNHEFHGDSSAAIAMSETAGVMWLRNRWQQVAPGLLLVGVDDLTPRQLRDRDQDRLTPLLQGRPPGVTLLLSHSPFQVEQAAAAGVEVMLSGHTHGGQIWPFGYLVAQAYPYLVGRHQIGGMSLIISRGTGLWGPRMRLWQPGEIIELTLRTAKRGEREGGPLPHGN
jgi:predicted MPP superfamily phosphohydrolase